MKFKTIWKIYFSPTGTTNRVLSIMADTLQSQLGGIPVCEFDFTSKAARETFPQLSKNDLVIFGCPTYAGRLPNLILPYIKTIQGNSATSIAVVTFGNRNFDNSLIELRDILTGNNFKVPAAAALSCEHSFSYTLGAGRPDVQDKDEIINFVKSAACVIMNDFTLPIEVPGSPESENHGGYYQPRDRHGNPIDIRKVKPVTNMSLCNNCGICTSICPMGSINPSNVSEIIGICIKCGACIKKCPASAKYYDDPGYLYHKNELEEMYARRASNAFFL